MSPCPMARKGQADQAQEWLEEQIKGLRLAIQKEGMDAPILGSRLTPNSGLIELDGRSRCPGSSGSRPIC